MQFMSDKQSLETKVAVTENDVKHLTADVEALTLTVTKLTGVIEEQNKIIARSKGIALGASLAVSAIWGCIVAAVSYFKP